MVDEIKKVNGQTKKDALTKNEKEMRADNMNNGLVKQNTVFKTTDTGGRRFVDENKNGIFDEGEKSAEISFVTEKDQYGVERKKMKVTGDVSLFTKEDIDNNSSALDNFGFKSPFNPKDGIKAEDYTLEYKEGVKPSNDSDFVKAKSDLKEVKSDYKRNLEIAEEIRDSELEAENTKFKAESNTNAELLEKGDINQTEYNARMTKLNKEHSDLLKSIEEEYKKDEANAEEVWKDANDNVDAYEEDLKKGYDDLDDKKINKQEYHKARLEAKADYVKYKKDTDDYQKEMDAAYAAYTTSDKDKKISREEYIKRKDAAKEKYSYEEVPKEQNKEVKSEDKKNTNADKVPFGGELGKKISEKTDDKKADESKTAEDKNKSADVKKEEKVIEQKNSTEDKKTEEKLGKNDVELKDKNAKIIIKDTDNDGFDNNDEIIFEGDVSQFTPEQINGILGDRGYKGDDKRKVDGLTDVTADTDGKIKTQRDKKYNLGSFKKLMDESVETKTVSSTSNNADNKSKSTGVSGELFTGTALNYAGLGPMVYMNDANRIIQQGGNSLLNINSENKEVNTTQVTTKKNYSFLDQDKVPVKTDTNKEVKKEEKKEEVKKEEKKEEVKKEEKKTDNTKKADNSKKTNKTSKSNKNTKTNNNKTKSGSGLSDKQLMIQFKERQILRIKDQLAIEEKKGYDVNYYGYTGKQYPGEYYSLQRKLDKCNEELADINTLPDDVKITDIASTHIGKSRLEKWGISY